MKVEKDAFPFRGNFDGNGFVVKNMTIDGINSFVQYGGLFGYIEDASITNLGLENVIIKNVEYAGGIACYASNSTLKYVFTDFSIKDSDGAPKEGLGISAKRGAAGLVYELKDSYDNECGLSCSYNNLPVSLETSNKSSTGSYNYIGGLVARLVNSSALNCYNNYYGRIKSIDELKGQNDNPHALVIGYISGDNSYFVNVFSLAGSYSSDGSDYTGKPTLYVYDNNIDRISKSPDAPLYSNLAGAVDNSIKDIWTNGYSLNDVNVSMYPSLRGLNREWKNELSETIIGFSELSESEALNDVLRYNIGKENEYSVALASAQLGLSGYSNVYTISSAEDLALLAKLVNNSEISTTGCEFMLLQDIDLSSMYWTPIGINEEHAFSGIFNFNGHVITGLTIDAVDLSYVGLFGYVSRAYILNGYLNDVFIRVRGNSSNTRTYVGSLVGYAYNTSISNISVTCRVYGETVSTLYIGGLAGTISGNNGYDVINVRVYGSTYGVDVQDYSQYIAQDRDAVTGEEKGTIISSDIHVAGISTRSNVYAGGVIGFMEGNNNGNDESIDYKLMYATNRANVARVSLADVNTYAGGIVGYATTFVTLSVCSNKAKVKAYSNQFDMTGGIVGYAFRCTITDCALDASGYVEGRLQLNNTGLNYLSFVGGIVGVMSEGTISYCAVFGSTYNNYSSSVNVILGAIIGYAENHDFEGGDAVCVYSNNLSGFSTPIGHYDYGRSEEHTSELQSQ